MKRHVLTRLCRRLPVSDDTGSLPLTMLLAVVGLGLSVVLGTVVLGEQRNTRVEQQRDAALNAAQSGIDVGLANLRAAVRTDGSGDPVKLPCAAINGATGTDNTSRYAVTMYYLASPPPNGDVTWAAANKLACGGPTVLPAYAMIVSAGRAGTAGTVRTLTATYAFTSTVQNDRIEGGVLKRYDINGIQNDCLTAGNAPAAGVQLAVETCNATKPGQQFMWQAGLTIGLKNTNLCADGRTNAADPTERAGNRVTLRTCAATTVANQQWSQNDHAAFVGTNNGSTLNNLCWNIVSGRIVLADKNVTPETCENKWGNDKSFFPSAEMGSGRAGWSTGQLVNSEQYGRCVDVTADDVNWGFLIVFPCKQSVTGTVLWNQTWDLPAVPTEADQATGYIHTTWSGKSYCLKSPGTVSTADRGDGTAANAVRLTVCTPTGTPAPEFAWTVRFDTGRWSTSYRIESAYNAASSNNCLSAVQPTGPASTQWTTFNLQFSKLVVAACNTTDLQKWNAISRFHESSLTDITER